VSGEALERVRAVDSGSQLDDVLALPDQLRDALWRVDSAGLADGEATGLAVCGMGGSGVGGLLARAAFGDELSLPLLVVRDYELAPWTPPSHAVLCVSYSGETEETLACFEAADAVGARRIVATTGGSLAEAARAADVPVIGIPSGLQPRAAVGYMFTIAAEVAAVVGVAPGLRTHIDSSAAHLESGRDALIDRAAAIAEQIYGTVPAIYGCDLTAPIAYRWKTQVNENAKQHAFVHELPELDHNEIVGWTNPQEGARFAAVFLDDCDLHPRARQRIELTRELVEPAAVSTHVVQTRGESRTERVLSLVLLGDLVSIYLAVLRGVDPTPVAVIEDFKARLASLP
jgi:glucose/mannose-6-phosphate isomerase